MSAQKNKEHPTKELLKIALDGWKASFLGSVPHRMMRTFAHHRVGEKFDTGLIFRELEAVNKGKHEELIEEINAFEKTLMTDIDSWLGQTEEE